MKELSKEDQERIEKAALFTMPVIGENFFMMGAKYEHSISFKKGKIEGFNEGIERVRKALFSASLKSDKILTVYDCIEVIEQLEEIKTTK